MALLINTHSNIYVQENWYNAKHACSGTCWNLWKFKITFQTSSSTL